MSGSSDNKLSLLALIALVIGSMIGGGIFSLPATFGRASGALGASIAWIIAGGGMLMLAFVFQALAERKPELDSGVFSYAEAGFGKYTGFLSALGFWGGCCVANVSYFILLKSSLGTFFPVFGEGNTPAAIFSASVLIWSFHAIILRGVQGAASINTIATVAKIIPILVFLGFVVWGFKADVFSANLWGDALPAGIHADMEHLEDYGFVGHATELMEQEQEAQEALELAGGAAAKDSLFDQVRRIMLVTVYVFVGIEGASVYSRYARNRRDVGLATVFGFLIVLSLLAMVTLLSYGVLGQEGLAVLRQPSMAGVLEALVGPWGTLFVSAGLVLAVLGAYLSWVLLAAEALFSAANNKVMPSFLSRENAHKVPVAALWLTNGLVQVFLIITLFTDYAFTLALELTSALCLIPYFLVAAYGLKLAVTGESYEGQTRQRTAAYIIGGIATLYALLMIYSGGVKYLLLSAVFFAPGSLLFIQARREQQKQLFTRPELVLFGLLAGCALAALYSLHKGYISL